MHLTQTLHIAFFLFRLIGTTIYQHIKPAHQRDSSFIVLFHLKSFSISNRIQRSKSTFYHFDYVLFLLKIYYVWHLLTHPKSNSIMAFLILLLYYFKTNFLIFGVFQILHYCLFYIEHKYIDLGLFNRNFSFFLSHSLFKFKSILPEELSHKISLQTICFLFRIVL